MCTDKMREKNLISTGRYFAYVIVVSMNEWDSTLLNKHDSYEYNLFYFIFSFYTIHKQFRGLHRLIKQ